MTALKSKLWLADSLLILVAMIWGTSYSLAKEAIAFYSVLGFLFIRFGLTFLLLTPSLIHEIWYAKLRLVTTLKIGLPLGVILLCIFLCETFGVFFTTASNAAFLISLCVIFTPFVEWGLLKKRPKNSLFFYSFLSCIGAGLLVINTELTLNKGDLLILGAAVLRAVMVTMTNKLTKNVPIKMLNLTAIQASVVISGSLLVGLVMGVPFLPLPSSGIFWGNMVYLVLFCTIFAFFIQNYAVKVGSPSRASILMGTEPLFGAIFAWWWLGESIPLLSWVGGLMIAISSILLMTTE